jgi:hypothetical protein
MEGVFRGWYPVFLEEMLAVALRIPQKAGAN